jgi:glutamate synthase (NADPH/NADH) large chain
VICLGDPGPWMAAGMTGGVIFIALWPELGLDVAAIRRRLAKGARCQVGTALGPQDVRQITELLTEYAQLLEESGQVGEAELARDFAQSPVGRFARVLPRSSQVAQDLSTE